MAAANAPAAHRIAVSVTGWDLAHASYQEWGHPRGVASALCRRDKGAASEYGDSACPRGHGGRELFVHVIEARASVFALSVLRDFYDGLVRAEYSAHRRGGGSVMSQLC